MNTQHSSSIQTEYVDPHCHILPGVDHGAKDAATAFNMANALLTMGFSSCIATPHFYFYEESADSFISRRNASFSSTAFPEGFKVIPGAEIAYESGLSRRCDLTKLVIGDTDRILVELPMKRFNKKSIEEFYDIRTRLGLKIVIAHAERYLPHITFGEFSELMEIEDIMFQMNLYSVSRFSSRILLGKLLSSGASVVFGTDIHGMDKRLSGCSKGMEKLKNILHPHDYARAMSCEELML